MNVTHTHTHTHTHAHDVQWQENNAERHHCVHTTHGPTLTKSKSIRTCTDRQTDRQNAADKTRFSSGCERCANVAAVACFGEGDALWQELKAFLVVFRTHEQEGDDDDDDDDDEETKERRARGQFAAAAPCFTHR